MTNEEAIQQIAVFMADAENDATDLRDHARDLAPAFEQLSEMEQVSTLKSIAYASRIDYLTTRFRADLYALHSDMTEYAKAISIDGMLPQPRGGTR